MLFQTVSKRKINRSLLQSYCFCEYPGKPNLLCFKDMAAWVLEYFKIKGTSKQLIS